MHIKICKNYTGLDDDVYVSHYDNKIVTELKNNENFIDHNDVLMINGCDKTVSINELLEIFPSMLEGKLSNKILVDVNK